jgi:hypothetical protein
MKCFKRLYFSAHDHEVLGDFDNTVVGRLKLCCLVNATEAALAELASDFECLYKLALQVPVEQFHARVLRIVCLGGNTSHIFLWLITGFI